MQHTMGIRHAESADTAAIVALHEKAFRGSFLTQLGGAFLERYYSLVMDFDGGIVLIAGDRGRVDGFVAGFVHPEEFYRQMRRPILRWVRPVLSALARNPALVGRVTYSLGRIRRAARAHRPVACELASIAVHPEATGQGVGKSLVKAFIREAWIRGAHSVYLTTDADHNDCTNHFYGMLGFQLQRQFEQYNGRPMNEYVILQQASSEV